MGALSSAVCADFVDDSKATVKYKNYYYNNDYREGGSPGKIEEWAQGLIFDLRSGYSQGTWGLGVDSLLLFGMKLDSGRGRNKGGSMIPTDDGKAVNEWSRWGATAKFKVGETEMFYGTLQPSLPVLLTNDGRVLPQTYMGGQVTTRDVEGMVFTAGRVTRATSRASTDRTGLAITGGTHASDAFLFGGVDLDVMPGLKGQYYYGKLEGYYQQHFLGGIYQRPLSQGLSLKVDTRFFKTDSIGANSAGKEGFSVAGYTRDNTGKIDNTTWSTSIALSVNAHAITIGYQSVSDGSNFVQPAQGSLPNKGAIGSSLYLQTDRLIQSFNRAGEQTTFAQYGYDFASLGLPGLRVSTMYLKGTSIKTRSGRDQSEWERDISVDYVIQSGVVKGLGITWLNGKSHSEASRDQDQNRVFISYSVPIL